MPVNRDTLISKQMTSDEALQAIQDLQMSDSPTISNHNRSLLQKLGIDLYDGIKNDELNSLIRAIKTGIPELQKELENLKFDWRGDDFMTK
jgi:hypothetical protein